MWLRCLEKRNVKQEILIFENLLSKGKCSNIIWLRGLLIIVKNETIY